MPLLKTIIDYCGKNKPIVVKEFLLPKIKGGISNRDWPLPYQGNSIIEISEDLRGDDKWITIVHEFLHLDCMDYNHRCPLWLTRCNERLVYRRNRCPCEDEIEEAGKRIFYAGGLVMDYLRAHVRFEREKRRRR